MGLRGAWEFSLGVFCFWLGDVEKMMFEIGGCLFYWVPWFVCF